MPLLDRTKCLILLLAMASCDMTNESNAFPKETVLRQDVPDLTVGAGYVAHRTDGALHLLPTRTPIGAAPIISLAKSGDGWAEAVDGPAVPTQSTFACAAGPMAFYADWDRVHQVDLGRGEVATFPRADRVIAADCSLMDANPAGSRGCPEGDDVLRKPLSPDLGWLEGCWTDDRKAVALRIVGPDGAIVDLGSVAAGRGSARTWQVRHLPWSGGFLLQATFPTEDLVGVFDGKGWIEDFSILREGPWYEERLGFGAGRSLLAILRPEQPLAVFSTTGKLFLAGDDQTSVLEDIPPTSAAISDDGCHVSYVRTERIDSKRLRLSVERIDLCAVNRS